MNRSIKIDIISPPEMRSKIIASIRQHRFACRQFYSLLTLSELAGAKSEMNEDVVKIIPDKEHQFLTYIKNPERAVIKNELLPTAMSFVWDSCKGAVETCWKSKDVEFPKATRGYLTLNGARDIAFFNRIGIACPRLTAKPKFEEHSLFLKWDHEIGEVEFKVPRLDGARYYVYRNLRENVEGWKMGTLYLNERDGKIFAGVSYSCPDVKTEINKERILNISFTEDPENFIKIFGPDGVSNYDTISAAEAVAWLDELSAIRKKFESQKRATGNPRKPWGSSKQWKTVQSKLSHNTERRDNGVTSRNHLWTRRIVSRAQSWNCGTIAVNNLPESIFGRQWQWYQFKTFLEYKIAEIGGVCVVNA